VDYLYLVLAFLLVFANGFFVATEFAIVRIRNTRLRTLAEEGRPGAGTALKMTSRLDGYLSACQFGITLASLGLGWLGEPAFARLVEPAVAAVVPQGSEQISHSVGLAISFGIITFLHIVVGELAPKSLAIQKAEATTLAVALPMRAFYLLFFPGIWFLNGMATKLLKLVGLRPLTEMQDAHNEDELRMILASSAQAGAITASRAELLERALSMLEKTVRQVLVPRTQIRWLDLEEPLERNISEARVAGHTWLPVCRGSLDEIEGMVNVKDLFFLLSRGELKSLAQVQRPVLFVPENATLEQLLSDCGRGGRGSG
jgi:CBS domain containing-hemolysin-like protein